MPGLRVVTLRPGSDRLRGIHPSCNGSRVIEGVFAHQSLATVIDRKQAGDHYLGWSSLSAGD